MEGASHRNQLWLKDPPSNIHATMWTWRWGSFQALEARESKVSETLASTSICL